MMLFTEEMNLKMKNVLRWTAKTIVTKYHKFQTLYTPSQNIALDESILMWKGWLEICQLIPNKAANRGIKTYEVCESQTGYLWRFEVHTQKKQHRLRPTIPFRPSLRLLYCSSYKGWNTKVKVR